MKFLNRLLRRFGFQLIDYVEIPDEPLTIHYVPNGFGGFIRIEQSPGYGIDISYTKDDKSFVANYENSHPDCSDIDFV